MKKIIIENDASHFKGCNIPPSRVSFSIPKTTRLNNPTFKFGISVVFVIFYIIFLFVLGCGKEQKCEGDACAISEKTETPCGDGVCDTAEQNNPELCPADCPNNAVINKTIPNQNKKLPPQDEPTEGFFALPENLTFIVDEGIRVYNASNPGAKVNADGSVTLIYERKYQGRFKATAEDGLLFAKEEKAADDNMNYIWAQKMWDGMWRTFGFDRTRGSENCLGSMSSSDLITFNKDEGCRYELQENEEMGTYDTYIDANGGVVLLYVDRSEGVNSVKRAYSSDYGMNFEFTTQNVTGDLYSPYGTYVDQKIIAYEDKLVLIAMRYGTLFALYSEDNGVSFARYKESIIEPSDFSEIGNVITLHDPVIVTLPDGRLRMYVAAFIQNSNTGTASEPQEGDETVIVSATTQ